MSDRPTPETDAFALTARQVGFNGEANIFTDARFSIRFLKGRTEHLSRAQESPNHFFWNRETETFYYINPEKRLFRVQFVEEGAK